MCLPLEKQNLCRRNISDHEQSKAGLLQQVATPTSATVREQSQMYICDPSNSRNQSF
ncbi:hypothetical protein MTR_3g036640 [Medicago truncatula]|uniref:Uncharacterized protein n=1 Tax=Medicago truncatula TaxID=3880 RepID=G7IXC1_MEDTR|nr:hypothetical protein MTR_3g036640 [Medicago truncatula]